MDNYFTQIRPFIIFAVAVFLLAVAFGYFVAAPDAPAQTERVYENVERIRGELRGMHPLFQFLTILLANSFTLVLCILLGVVAGIFPFLVLFINGSVAGILISFLEKEGVWNALFFGIAPSSLISIPLIIIGAGIGFRMGGIALNKISADKSNKRIQPNLKEELDKGFNFSWDVILPLLAVATALEVFIVPYLIK